MTIFRSLPYDTRLCSPASHRPHRALPQTLLQRPHVWIAVALTALAAAGGALPSSARAQSVLVTVRGLVTDPSGAVLPGVTIVITEPATQLTVRAVTTDGNGNYEVADVKPGRYRLTATLDGFAPYVADDLLLESGQTRRVDITLNVGGATDQVTVVAGAQVITTDSGTISGRFDKTQFADNPTVDTYPSNLSMMTTQPGIQGGNGGWTVRISGQGPSQQSWGMDGIENDRTGDQTNNMNWFEEATVTTVNATADSARIVNWNMTSKRGNNELRGMAYHKHFDSAFNARPFFEDEKVDSQTREWQAELGGPILSGRTFFYGTWMQQNIPTGSFQQATVPTLEMRRGDFSQFDEPLVDPQTGRPFPGNRIPADRLSPLARQAQELYYPQPNQGGPDALTDNHTWTHPFPNSGFRFHWPFLRLDHNLSSKNSLYFRWLQRKSWHANSGSLPAFTSTRVRNHQQFTISDTHVFSPTLVNTLRVGLSTISRRACQ
ncbi:MAG: carboxypeptidase regulatory-like domain-containing protein [Vicinamibacteraceae bacterium]